MLIHTEHHVLGDLSHRYWHGLVHTGVGQIFFQGHFVEIIMTRYIALHVRLIKSDN